MRPDCVTGRLPGPNALTTLATIFAFLILAALAWRLWLLRRHASHVASHRDRVPPDFAALVPLEAHQKAADYTRAKVRIAAIEALALDGALLAALSVGGGLAALDAWSHAAFGEGHLRELGTVFAFLAVGALAALPFDAWRTFGVEARFGFNQTTPATFLADLAKGAVLALALGTPMVLAVSGFIHAAGAWWWVWAWVAWVAFTLVLVAVFPRWIAPLFNKFTPLEEGELRRRIESLVARCGFRAGGLFVMDGSRRSAHGNAYFSGFGANKRIVFYDTLLSRLAPEEIEAVLAHELGHFKMKHIVKRIGVMFAVSLGFLGLLGFLKTQGWFFTGLGIMPMGIAPMPGSLSDNNAMALILFMLALPVFTFLFSPLTSISSRKHEFEADAFAARHTDARDLVSALVKMYEDNASTLTPDPLHSAFYDSHPPASLRINKLLAA